MKEVGYRILRTSLLAAALHLGLSSTESLSQVQLQTVVGGLSRPVLITHAREDRIFIVEQAGTVRIFYGGGLMGSPFLNISGLVSTAANEQGLLGLAFHPNYPATPFIFVHFTSNGNVLPDGTDPVPGDNLIVRYNVSSDRNVVDQTSAKVLLQIPQPFSNHNGGMIAFGPDGCMYIAKGDGGSGNDPFSAAQNPNNILGKMLRIDVDQNPGIPPYHGTPPTNPYMEPDGREEVFLLGLRNPWRFSFDRTTGDLWIGDVGQGSREEINRLAIDASAPGSNFGWRIFEGTFCTGLDPCTAPAQYVPPVFDYSSAGSSPQCSVTGGYVYRGILNPALIGTYIFADYCSGEIFSFSHGSSSLLLDTGELISSFGENSRGEIYVAGHGSGQILKILPNPAPPASINGRVLDSRGRGMSSAFVVRRDTTTGAAISIRTNTFGFYSIPNNELNREYTLTAFHKRGTFEEKVFTLTDDFYGIDIVSTP